MNSFILPLFILILLVAGWFLYSYFQKQQEALNDKSEVPEIDIVNDTNYNIDNTGLNEDRFQNLSAQEAQNILNEWEASDYIPSDEEYRRVQDAIKP